jgi:hypothetical protein
MSARRSPRSIHTHTPVLWIFVSLLAAVEGINAIRSGVLLYQVVGGLALLGAAAMIVSTLWMTGLPARIRQLLGIPPKPGAGELRPIETVHCTMVERLVPIALTTLAILMVGAAAVYTAWMVGLW